MPLVGWEKLATGWPPTMRGVMQLHSFVLLLDGANDEAYFLDFLPEDPNSPDTVVELLTLGSVKGVARCRKLPGRGPSRSRLPAGSSAKLVGELTHCEAVAVATKFTADWSEKDTRLSLMWRNCRHYSKALVDELLAAEREAAAGGPARQRQEAPAAAPARRREAPAVVGPCDAFGRPFASTPGPQQP